MKIPLSDQITEATLRRDELQSKYKDGLADKTSLDRQEGICLTLQFNQVYEADIRRYIANLKGNSA